MKKTGVSSPEGAKIHFSRVSWPLTSIWCKVRARVELHLHFPTSLHGTVFNVNFLLHINSQPINNLKIILCPFTRTHPKVPITWYSETLRYKQHTNRKLSTNPWSNFSVTHPNGWHPEKDKMCLTYDHLSHSIPLWTHTERSQQPQDGHTPMELKHTEMEPTLPIQSLTHPSCGWWMTIQMWRHHDCCHQNLENNNTRLHSNQCYMASALDTVIE